MEQLSYVRIIRVRSTALRNRSARISKARAVQPISNGAWVEGHLIKPICVGHEFQVRCTCFNGTICVCGRVYKSSKVTLIRGDNVFTEEVQYKVLRVPLFDPVKSLRSWK